MQILQKQMFYKPQAYYLVPSKVISMDHELVISHQKYNVYLPSTCSQSNVITMTEKLFISLSHSTIFL